jgi:hypothetical protein
LAHYREPKDDNDNNKTNHGGEGRGENGSSSSSSSSPATTATTTATATTTTSSTSTSSTTSYTSSRHLQGLQHGFLRKNVALLVRLRHKETGRTVVIANAHLFWNPSFEYVKVRVFAFLSVLSHRKLHVFFPFLLFTADVVVVVVVVVVVAL